MNKNLQLPSEKNFGITIGFILIVVSIILEFNIFLIYAGTGLIIIGLFFSKLLKLPNYIWLSIGNILAKIANPIILSTIYFFLITPIGLTMKLLGYDNLKLKNYFSYWSYTKKFKVNFDDQF